MSLNKSFVTSFRKLVLAYVIATFRGVIIWRINIKQLSNLPTEMIIFQLWVFKKTIKGSWCCSGGFTRGNQKFCHWGFAPLLSGDMEQMQKVKGLAKGASILYNIWFNLFMNWRIWLDKNYHPYMVDLQNLFWIDTELFGMPKVLVFSKAKFSNLLDPPQVF